MSSIFASAKTKVTAAIPRDTMGHSVFVALIVIFIINPFVSFLLSLYWMRNKTLSGIKNYIFFLIALFLGFVACTQSTKYGDVSRMYDGIILNSFSFQSNPVEFLITSKHILYDLVNQSLYWLSGNVKFVPLFWVTCIYFTVFLAIEDLLKYKGLTLSKKNQFYLIIGVLFCFINFTQITEIMKQGVSTALFLFSFTSLLLNKKIKGLIILLCAINVHFSVFFFFPLFFIKWIPKKILLLLIPFSFLMRTTDFFTFFDRFHIFNTTTNDVYMVEAIAESMELYSNQMDNFFSSSSAFFVYIFWMFLVLSVCVSCFSQSSLLSKACLLFVSILNMTYLENHNYTRLLTMLFPFYIFLYADVMNIKKHKIIKPLLFILFFSTFVVNFRLLYLRLFTDVYYTSFMDNSFLNLLIYPSYMYLL